MFSFPDPKTKDPKKRRVQRILEIIPGVLTWTTLLGMFFLSMIVPIWMAVFIIIFDIYWIFRTIFIAYYSVAGYRKLKKGKNIDWWERCQNISNPENYANIIKEKIGRYKESLKERGELRRKEIRIIKKEILSHKKYLEEVRNLIKISAQGGSASGEKDQILDWREIVHVVLLPTANEIAEIIEQAIQAIADSNFPNHQFIILLATEERENEEKRLAKVSYLQDKFKGVFREFLVTTHKVKTGEMKCKASNATYAAKELKVYLDKNGIDYKKVILSNFDCDTVAHPQYFAALTYAFITNPERLQFAYQPIPMYHNNLWDTNAFVRVIVTGSSFWHIFQSTRPEGMVTFASHSESFDTLVKLDFWPVNIINEDSIIYWKGFSYFHGKYRVMPIHLPVSLDAALAPTYWQTIVNQYKQKRRWAYGIEHFPTVMRAIWNDKQIPFSKRLKVAFEMLEGHHSWATASFILAILGWLPLIFGGEQFNQSVLAHNLPFFTRYLMTIAMAGLVVSMSLSFLLMPPKPAKYSKWKYAAMLLQWVLVPISAPFLGALPAVDSQTRLMLGKYFGEFWVTEKTRK